MYADKSMDDNFQIESGYYPDNKVHVFPGKLILGNKKYRVKWNRVNLGHF